MQEQIVMNIEQLAKQYGVSQARIGDTLADIITKIYNKQKPDQLIKVTFDLSKGGINSQLQFTVIDDCKDDEYDDFIEIPLSEAKKHGNFNVGDTCEVEFDILGYFQKNEISTIMQMFRQKLNEINNIRVYNQWAPRIGEIINCVVEKHDAAKGFYIIDLGDGNMGFMSRSDSIPGEDLKPGQKYKFFVKDVKEQSKGWPIILSRADAGFVSKLLEIEVPEIGIGDVVINKIERIAGFKTKVAVSTTSNNYDACAIVIGPKGSRIKTVSEQLFGEKIEIIKYSDNINQFIVNACGAKNLVGYKYSPATNENEQDYIKLIVNDDILPIIIGKKGFNIKLISKLLNCSIDINTVKEAQEHGIEFERVVNTTSHFGSNRDHGNSRDFGHRSNNSNNYSSRPSGKANNYISADSILNDIENLSQEELEERYNVRLKQDVPSNESHSNRSDTSMRKLFEDSEILNSQEYEDFELSDAFADEIADILNDEKN